MELRHLRSFRKAAEEQSFTRAAGELSLTQAAVSQHIAALEKELGVILFERTGRAVKLTEAGQRLYEYAQQILQLIEEALQTVGSKSATVSGTLKIAASTVPAETVLSELLQAFLKRYPDVKESVTVSDSRQAAEAVRKGAADFGLVGSLPEDAGLAAQPLCEDELIFVVPPGHPLAEKKRISLSRLQQEPLIVREVGSGSRSCVERALEQAQVSPGQLNIVMQMNSNDAIRGAVERGLGGAFFSRRFVERDLQQKRLAEISVQGVQFKRQLYLVTDPDRRPAAPLRAFLEFIDQWIKERSRR